MAGVLSRVLNCLAFLTAAPIPCEPDKSTGPAQAIDQSASRKKQTIRL